MFVSVVMPCLNEHETVGRCVAEAFAALKRYGLEGEVVVADNGSTDGSVEIARSLGARVVPEPQRGYGNAYRTGIAAARGEYIVIGDSDDSYDFGEIGRFVEKLREGYDLVMGTRLRGSIRKGAMPWLHRYIGNPLLTAILNRFFHAGISDAHCGMRAFTKQAFFKMDLQTAGMEFASEMVIKAALSGLRITEIPITLRPDGRSGAPHLRTFRDGWRHLRFMLLHSPTYLYLVPGATLSVLGIALMTLMLAAPNRFLGSITDLNLMVAGSMFTILGYQIILLGIYARIFAVTQRFLPQGTLLTRLFKIFNLERGLILGAAVFLLGIAVLVGMLIYRASHHMEMALQVRLSLLASTFIIVGAQTVFASFFLSMLGIERK